MAETTHDHNPRHVAMVAGGLISAAALVVLILRHAKRHPATVYGVWQHYYEDDTLHGVFATRELAADHADVLNNERGYQVMEVEEIQIYDRAPVKRTVYQVTMDRDGIHRRAVDRWEYETYGLGVSSGQAPYGNRWCAAWATDRDEAQRLVEERITKEGWSTP